MLCPQCGLKGMIWGSEGNIVGSKLGVYVLWFPCGWVNGVEYVESMELTCYGVTTAIGSLTL